MSSPDRVCAIDVGTNTLLALSAERTGSSTIAAIEDHSAITGLGRGLDASGQISAEAIERLIAALDPVLARARALEIDRIAAVGTSALRDAGNREAVVAAVSARCGVTIGVIPGAREAALTFRGARAAEPSRPDDLVIDIGGGSTEIVGGGTGAEPSGISLDIGSVRLYERHLRSDPPEPSEIGALESEITRALGALVDARSRTETGEVVALAGTAITVAAFARGIPKDRLAAAAGVVLEPAECAEISAQLLAMSLAERRAHPSIPPGRADVLAAGAAILASIVARLGVRAVRVSDGGVRWGLAREVLLERVSPPDRGSR